MTPIQSSDNRQAESANRQSDTPRTEAEVEIMNGDFWNAVYFARTLERELSAARAEVKRFHDQFCQETLITSKLIKERDAWKAAHAADANYQRELRADRDRLDWLTENLGAIMVGDDCDPTDHIDEEEDWAKAWRAAIDAAMHKQE